MLEIELSKLCQRCPMIFVVIWLSKHIMHCTNNMVGSTNLHLIRESRVIFGPILHFKIQKEVHAKKPTEMKCCAPLFLLSFPNRPLFFPARFQRRNLQEKQTRDLGLRPNKDNNQINEKIKRWPHLSLFNPGRSTAINAIKAIRYIWSAIDSGPFIP